MLPEGITDHERERMQREIDRVPVGGRVKVRRAPGLGVGVVREHITSTRKRDGSDVLPYHGFVEARVAFDDDSDALETFNTRELILTR